MTRLTWPWVWRAVASAGSGSLLALSFPPVDRHETAWVALVPMLLVARFTPPRAAARWGWVTGCVFWTPNLAWLLRLAVTGAPAPLAAAGWLLLSAYAALYFAAFAYCTSVVSGAEERAARSGPPSEPGPDGAGEAAGGSVRAGLRFLVAVPVLWTGFEYLRSNFLTGFPWNPLGGSQYRNLAVAQIAEWGGVYAVSALVALLNAALTAMGLRLTDVYTGRRRSRFQVELMVGLLVCAACCAAGLRAVHRTDARYRDAATVKIVTIQPNIPQLKKWVPEADAQIYERLRDLTRLASRVECDLTVWPETAVPRPLLTDDTTMRFVKDLCREAGPLLVGTMEVMGERDEPVYCNSSILVDREGGIRGLYRKRRLVPFGEYIPLESRVPAIARLAPLGFSCAPGQTNVVLRLPGKGAGFSVLICFEDTIPDLARDASRDGAAFLINQTNDGWFDGSSGALQHLSHCVFRCIENRMEAVRAANTGVTSHIDAVGRTEALAVDGRKTGFAGLHPYSVRLRPNGMPRTFYSRCGDWAFALPCGIASGVFLVLVVVLRKRQHATTSM